MKPASAWLESVAWAHLAGWALVVKNLNLIFGKDSGVNVLHFNVAVEAHSTARFQFKQGCVVGLAHSLKKSNPAHDPPKGLFQPVNKRRQIHRNTPVMGYRVSRLAGRDAQLIHGGISETK